MLADPVQRSNASLLGESPSVSRHASSLAGCDTAEDVSLASPMSVNDLQLPNPRFHHGVGGSGSSTSIASAENDPNSPAETSFSTLSSSQSSSNMGSNSTYRSPRRSTSQPRLPSSHCRQASTSTSLSKSSRTTLRSGVPHAPYNHIQIVLPAPLGLQPNREPLSRRPQTYADPDGSSRLSVVDQWTPKTYRSEGSYGMEKRPRSVSSSEPQPSISSQSSSRSHSTHSREPRRTNSALSSTSSHNSSSSVSPTTPSSVGYGSAPPVPRIPSIYNNATFDTSYHEHRGLGAPILHHPDARGRPIDPSPPSFANTRSLSLPPSTADSSGFLQEHPRGRDLHPASGNSKYNAHT
ncbi:hypothetical protein BDZ89DRAFT_461421 [Hymenopellis radicata]|nr:hypothetical protein BDZ89DRAFT_461421 [Hymenopellis radicata]